MCGSCEDIVSKDFDPAQPDVSSSRPIYSIRLGRGSRSVRVDVARRAPSTC